VTQPADSVGGVYKRLTVVATWTSRGKSHTRTSSTLVAPTQRGLPLPDFKFTGSGSSLAQCRNPGDTLTFAFTVKNNGARDEWTVAASSSSSGAPTWSYYSDVNGNNSYDSGTDTALGTSAGLPSTGVLEPTEAKTFLAVASVPGGLSLPPPYTWVVKFTTTSVAQPTFAQELTTTTNVQSAACSGATPTSTPSSTPTSTSTPPAQPGPPCTTFSGLPTASTTGGGTLYQYYLHNVLPNVNNTTAQSTLTISKSAPTGGTLWDYSTDLSSVAGRQLNAPAGAGPASVADWRYQMPATSKLKGTATATIYAAPVSGLSSATPSFTVTMDRLNSAGTSLGTLGTATFTSVWGCTGYRPFTVSFSFSGSGQTIGANEQIRLQVKVTNAVPMQLAYDTSTFPSGMVLPVTSGVG
jgi:hypothetical protein